MRLNRIILLFLLSATNLLAQDIGTTEVKVLNQSVINLVLEDDANILNEVEVIATGYDKINKKTYHI